MVIMQSFKHFFEGIITMKVNRRSEMFQLWFTKIQISLLYFYMNFQ